MNLYFGIAAAAITLASYAGVFAVGSKYGERAQIARAASTQEIADEAAAKAVGDGSKLLSSITVQNKTIYQKATHEVQTRTVYADCRHDDSMLNTINEAITGRGDSSPGAPGASVPGNKPVGGPVVRRDNAQVDRRGRDVPGVPVRGAGTAVQ